MFRHADVVCLCLVCILWQFSMLRSVNNNNDNNFISSILLIVVLQCWSWMQ